MDQNNFENQQTEQQTYQQPYQQTYQQPYQQPMQNGNMETPLSLGSWLLTLIVLYIPCIGFIMTIVWACSNDNIGRRNFARAMLIIKIVGAVLAAIVYVFFIAAIATYSNGNYV